MSNNSYNAVPMNLLMVVDASEDAVYAWDVVLLHVVSKVGMSHCTGSPSIPVALSAFLAFEHAASHLASSATPVPRPPLRVQLEHSILCVNCIAA
jgi:hypothetical protein